MMTEEISLVRAIERLIEAKLRPRSLMSSDDGTVNETIGSRDAGHVADARRALQGALEDLMRACAAEAPRTWRAAEDTVARFAAKV